MADTLWIHLKNLVQGREYHWGEGIMFGMGNYLVSYIDESCKLNSNFSGSDYTFEPRTSSVTDKDWVIYLLKNDSKSIVAQYSSDPLGFSGSTADTNEGVISEIYLEPQFGDAELPRLLANIAYHELLHNKLDAYQ